MDPRAGLPLKLVRDSHLDATIKMNFEPSTAYITSLCKLQRYSYPQSTG